MVKLLMPAALNWLRAMKLILGSFREVIKTVCENVVVRILTI